MTSEVLWPWIALVALGALHGLNPGMGWLFAVAQGLQQGERRAVWRALGPMAAGHGLAIVVAVTAAAAVGSILPDRVLRWSVAGLLLALGLRQLMRHTHPRGGGMRVSGGQLAWWSFLVASVHGAGLMAVPFAIAAGRDVSVAHADHAHHAHAVHTASAVPVTVIATVVHTAAYFAITALLAVLVYEVVGLARLRRYWVNIDRVWAVTLIITAGAVLLT